MTTVTENTPDIHWDDDVETLRKLAYESFEDERIRNYFEREHVRRAEVIDVVDRDDVYLKCRATEAFKEYAECRTEIDKLDERIAAAEAAEIVNWKTILTGLAILPTISIALSEIADRADPFFKVILILFSAFAAASAGACLGRYLQHRSILNPFAPIMVLGLLILAACGIALPVAFAAFPWDPVGAYANIGPAFLVGALFSQPKILRDSRDLALLVGQAIVCLIDWPSRSKRKEKWIDESRRKLIYPAVVRAINHLLGAKSAKLLVEQDSGGLRRLQDPGFTVSTKSELRLWNLLKQMDGGSIAVTGPRGAGKSTLLRRICAAGRNPRRRQLSIYLSAPAEYVASEFLAELFQQVCDEYLKLHGTPVPGMRYRGLRTHQDTVRVVRGVTALLMLALRTIFFLALLTVAFGPLLTGVHPTGVIAHWPIGHWRDELTKDATALWNRYQTIIQIVAGVLALFWWPRKAIRRYRLRTLRRPPLAQRARDYSIHLKIERTKSQTGALSLPAVRGASVSLSKGTSDKYIRWTMPELVSKLRNFIKDISSPGNPVIIGIDEIDRIGSVEQAERFIGEIKAVFGVPNCFFLVSVAEDVGFLFSRRSIVGQSTLEHSFDDVVVVDALGLEEARSLLSARVPGFTDGFVFLALALSAGLPREMIRVARRLVEVNLQKVKNHLLIGDLALRLVAENTAEVLRTSRNQLARLSLPDQWGDIFNELRNAIVLLRDEEASRGEHLKTIRNLCSLRPPDIARQADDTQHADGEVAAKIVSGLAAFACYGCTVIEAFDNDYFDLTAILASANDATGRSYTELAAARLELGISPESSQSIIHRFRAQSGLAPLPGSRGPSGK